MIGNCDDPLPHRILAVLGADDLKTSEEFYDVLEDVLGSAECNSNIGQGQWAGLSVFSFRHSQEHFGMYS